MSLVGTNRDDLSVGLAVSINPQSDRSRKLRVQGKIKEILTNAKHHTHGILVSLETGEVGRVKEVLSEQSISDGQANDSIKSNKMVEHPLIDLINKGEDHFVELKTSVLWSQNFHQSDIDKSKSFEVKKYGRNTSKFIIAKTLAGFLNSQGGTLIIGVKESKLNNIDEIIGVESEFGKLKDKNMDGYRRMLLDQVIKPYLPDFILHHINSYLNIRFEVYDELTICGIDIKPSDTKVFIKPDRGNDLFFIRVDASTRELTGEDIVNFCIKRFS